MKYVALCALLALGSVRAFAGDGTEGNPYTIAEAIALTPGATEYWAQGFIVGGRYDDFDAPFVNDFGVSMSDDSGETVLANCLQLKLESDGGRTTWGLQTNPGKLGSEIKFKGFRDLYSTYPSFEGVANAEILLVSGGGGVTTLQFSAASGTAAESVGAFVITVSRTDTNDAASAELQLSGTASAGSDYTFTASATNVSFAVGVASYDFTVTIVDDADEESAETLLLSLANVTGATLGTPSSYTLTITDNDTPAPVDQPWINEVDYDSIGTDSNEWVEIAGPAGVSLDGYELIHINEVGAVYNSNDLAGASWTFTDEGNGYGFFVIGKVAPGEGTADYTPAGWTTDELQNGGADSIQLRQKAGSVNVHLLDYEGNNANTIDDQATTTSDDNVTALKSIFLTGGPGAGYSSFTWTNTAGGSTPGAVNGGQTLEGATLTTNVKFTASSASVGEASVSYTVTVFKTVADGNVAGEIALSGTASGSGLDYSVNTTNFALNGATTSATFVVTIQDDAEVESAETVILTLANVTGGGVASPSAFTLTITDNDVGQSPPTLAAIGNKTVLTNSPLSFAVTATPTDGDTVTLSVSNAPAGSTFGSTNEVGTFTWLSPAPAGVYTMTFYAADNDGADSEEVSITVTSSPAPLNLNVWINELHYDNSLTDTNQGFEVAGEAGTDLSGYSLMAYDGLSGTVYSNVSLSGVIPDQSNGYGALWFDFLAAGDALQNATEGVALVYNSTGLIQFLSYEGSFVGVGGAANGFTSENIGVIEDSSTPVDWSLQLCGTGTNYASFTWSTNLPHSRGLLSACQVIPGVVDPNDEDGDHLPNAWENQYFGNNIGSDPYGDDDVDGFYNIEEFIAGTIPVGPSGLTNYFRGTSFAVSGASVSYASVTGRSYRLWSNTNLVAVPQLWSPAGGPQVGNGAVQTLSDTSGSTAPVYRITVEMVAP